MPREESLCQLFALMVLQGMPIAVYCQIAAADYFGLRLANLICCVLIQSALFSLMMMALVRLQLHDHQATLKWLSQRLNVRLMLAMIVWCFTCFCLGIGCSFRAFFLTNSRENIEWLYSMTTLLSFCGTIYAVELVKMHQQQQTWVRYASYLLFLLMSIGYLSELGIFTKKAEYTAEIYFMMVVVLFVLKIWWEQTPLIIKILLFIVEVIDIQSTISLVTIVQLPTVLLAFEIAKTLVLFVHALYTTVTLAQCIYRCIRNHSEVKEDQPMRPTAINSLEKVQLVDDPNITAIEITQDQKPRKDKECTICTLELQLYTEIYNIPCGHQYHCECLRQWLLVRNSCPTCRTRVG